MDVNIKHCAAAFMLFQLYLIMATEASEKPHTLELTSGRSETATAARILLKVLDIFIKRNMLCLKLLCIKNTIF